MRKMKNLGKNTTLTSFAIIPVIWRPRLFDIHNKHAKEVWWKCQYWWWYPFPLPKSNGNGSFFATYIWCCDVETITEATCVLFYNQQECFRRLLDLISRETCVLVTDYWHLYSSVFQRRPSMYTDVHLCTRTVPTCYKTTYTSLWVSAHLDHTARICLEVVRILQNFSKQAQC